jgi:hypothetical protein
LLAAPASAFDARDRTFEAGRVGAIVQGKTKPEDLVRIYGADNVQLTTIEGLGESWPGAYIYRNTDDQLELMFTDDGKRILKVSLSKNWKSKTGLQLGANRVTLERLNGGPFRFYGTGFEVGGQLVGNRRALAKFTIHVNPVPKPGRTWEYFVGEKTFSSRDPALKDVVVHILQVDFD